MRGNPELLAGTANTPVTRFDSAVESARYAQGKVSLVWRVVYEVAVRPLLAFSEIEIRAGF